MDEAAGPSTSGVVLSQDLANRNLQNHLINPLYQILKDKTRANAKCDCLRSCIARNSYPKGTTPSVPLKILNAPEELKKKRTSILQECAKQLTQALVNYHHGQIVS